jgi:transcriptional regulator with GAF, ATPase, and Fis domain
VRRVRRPVGAGTKEPVDLTSLASRLGFTEIWRKLGSSREPRPKSCERSASPSSYCKRLTTFAAQAVIAIENARLLNELRQRTTNLTERTAELTEALEQQTAASEVLQVISGSHGDLQPLFASMLEKAVRICDARFGNIHRWDRDALHLVATHNTPLEFSKARRSLPYRLNPKTSLGRMITTKAVVHVADAAAEPGYVELRDPTAVAAVELGGTRTALYVPMLSDNELIGAFTLSRPPESPLSGSGQPRAATP